MFRNLLVISSLAACCILVATHSKAQNEFDAQQAVYPEKVEFKTHPITSSILRNQAKRLNLYKTTASKRVIAESWWAPLGGLHLEDTTHCFYPTGHGSQFDLNTLRYNYFHPFYEYEQYFLQPERYYPATLYSMDVMTDSTYIYQNANGSVIHTATASTSWDINDRIATYQVVDAGQGGNAAEFKIELHYDTQNRPDTILIYHGYPSSQFPMTLTHKRVIEYNAQDQVVKDVAHLINSGLGNLYEYEMLYAYDANDNLTEYTILEDIGSGTPQAVENHKFQYYTDNTLKVAVHATPQFNFKDSFGYEPGIPFWTFLRTGNTVNGEWGAVTTDFWKHLNGQNLPDTMYKKNNVSGASIFKTILEYDSDGDPIKKKEGGSTFTYYYDVVNDVPSIIVYTTKAFPNPVGDLLKIEFSGSGQEKKKVYLYNEVGAKVCEASLPSGVLLHETDTKTLAPGMYYLIVTDNENKVMFRQPVVKN